MDMFYQFIRPLLFMLNEERSHHLAISALDRFPWLIKKHSFYKPVTVGTEENKIEFCNPVAIAAGLVKNGEALEALARLGVGAIEIGTVTPQQQLGNSGVRLKRLSKEKAIINRMGFNNQGFLLVRQRIAQAQLVLQKEDRKIPTKIGVNIGKQRDTPIEDASQDYIKGIKFFWNVADYFTLNFSSPNTEALRTLQYGEGLSDTISAVAAAWEALSKESNRRPPLFLKIAPELSDATLEQLIAVCRRYSVAALVATNTLKVEKGGLSGQPLIKHARSSLERIKMIAPTMPVIASGGIIDCDEAMLRLKIGASMVQLYTGLIFNGPGLVAALFDALQDCSKAPK